MTYLDKMTPGQSGQVIIVTGDSATSRRLMEMGLVPGRHIKYLRNAPMRDPLEIQIGTSYLSLRRSEAALVAVELESGE